MYSCLILNNPYNNLLQTAILSEAAQRGADQVSNEGKSCHGSRPVAATFTPCAPSIMWYCTIRTAKHMMTIYYHKNEHLC